MFEFVLTVFGEAAKLAFANLGLGSPRDYPGVAPGSENTGCDSWGNGFGSGNGFSELVVENGPSFCGFGGIGEESVDPGADDNGEIFSEKIIF